MKLKKIAIYGLLFFVLLACQKDGVVPSFELHMKFWNPTGTNPQIEFDKAATSPEIKIDFTKRFESIVEAPSYTKVLIDNFRIIGAANQNYVISDIQAQEYKDDLKAWKEDVEFRMKFSYARDLVAVLVLDVSSSLGTDFLNVKNYAKTFIDQTYAQAPNAKVAIVAFSTSVTPSKFFSNKDEAKRFIEALKQEEFTSLYDAMNKGIELLNQQPGEAKAMLTFTDGTDNNSRLTNSETIVSLLKAENKTKIASYTIGLQGKSEIDQVVLKKLTANGGVAEFPKNITELQRVFAKFTQSISNVYNLTYLRNQQPIPQAQARKLKFIIKASEK